MNETRSAYEIVIVGAGIAGSVLAYRLAERGVMLEHLRRGVEEPFHGSADSGALVR